MIGLGAIGREHLDIYRNLPGVQLTAVADARFPGSDEFGVPSFGSTDALLGSGLVDAVSLCTPDDIHYQDSLSILEAGVHLLLEKPVSTSAEEAENLVKAAESSGLTVMPGHTLRFEPKYLTAHRLVESGHIGDVVHGYVRRNNKTSVADRVKGRTSVTFFLGIHDIDAVTWVAGRRVTAVQAMETTQRTSDGGQAVAVTANLRLDNGGIIQLEAAWGLPDDFPTDIDARLRLVADRGELSIDIHEQGMRAFGDTLGYPVPVAASMYGKTQGALHEELDAFVRAVRGEIPLPITMREGADAVHVATAIDKAIRTGSVEEVTYR
ncbi:Gfo/Idh/MocA family protein [Micromonospora olivasterospora]|uniref:Gfo/Idh/MocA family protein n=1 Tax=Micromonospora olivasterospora TaxID=1880 RepID=UPI0014792D63|nr:Gfo/Idh/MocA family oxidoreductase [Micromonospora olivasterospora]